MFRCRLRVRDIGIDQEGRKAKAKLRKCQLRVNEEGFHRSRWPIGSLGVRRSAAIWIKRKARRRTGPSYWGRWKISP
jgi:hypothetical protein